MSEHFINLGCANCGAKLDVYDDMERFACGYCGTEMAVQRRGGTVALKAVTDAIKQVQVGTDKTAAELALARLRQDLAALEARSADLKSVPPPPVPAGKIGCVVTPAIGVLGIGVAGWIATARAPEAVMPLGLALGVSVFMLFVGFRLTQKSDGTKHEAWKRTKAALDAETSKVRQHIAQQMKIVSESGPATPK
jgi:hypothetical protein